jgi:hypothetical protein
MLLQSRLNKLDSTMSAIINDSMLKKMMEITKIIALDDNKYASK